MAQLPPPTKRLIKSLATVTKPASPSFNTQALIEGKVKNWEFTTMLILRDHYTEVIAELVRLTHSLSTHDWQEPFQVAPSLASGQAPPGRESGANRSPDFCQTGGWQNSHSPPPPPPERVVTQAPQSPPELTTTAKVQWSN